MCHEIIIHTSASAWICCRSCSADSLAASAAARACSAFSARPSACSHGSLLPAQGTYHALGPLAASTCQQHAFVTSRLYAAATAWWVRQVRTHRCRRQLSGFGCLPCGCKLRLKTLSLHHTQRRICLRTSV